MRLGRFTIGPFLLAPMGGVSQQPFRVLCRELGASLATTELIAPELLLDDETRRRVLAFDAERERPFSVQLHGQDEAVMARAAIAAVEHGADVLELNMGNPLRGAGAFFLLKPDRGARLLRETGCEAVMIGRAALGNPLVFSRLCAVADGGAPERERVLRRHWTLHHAFHGKEALSRFLPHLAWYARAVGDEVGEAVARVKTQAQLEAIIGPLAAANPLMEPGLAPLNVVRRHERPLHCWP